MLLQTGKIVGVEALVRWEHQGLVPPAEFIPLAEETGLTVPLGHWVLREACRQVMEWGRTSPYPAGALAVSVNLSAKQFQHENLAYDVLQRLEETGLPPGSLILEITESIVMEDASLTVNIMQKLKTPGVKIAIDDFGTGYSSLSYLKRFPADYLKIDCAFVDGLGKYPESTAIVSAMIGLAQDLGLKTIAEGVETEEQLERLKAFGCELGQGYHFTKPLDAVAASEFLTLRPQPAR